MGTTFSPILNPVAAAIADTMAVEHFAGSANAVFNWQGLSLVPTTGSTIGITRATVGGARTDVNGTIYQPAAGESGPQGTVRVVNLLSITGAPSEDWSDAKWAKSSNGAGSNPAQVSGQTYTFATGGATASDRSVFEEQLLLAADVGDTITWRIEAYADAAVTASIVDTFNQTTPITIDVTTENQIFSGTYVASLSTTVNPRIGLIGNDAGNVTRNITFNKVQFEVKKGPNKNPSPDVSVGVLSSPFHGYGIDGVDHLTNSAGQAVFNGNTVSSNVVTESEGAVITASNSKFACLSGNSTDFYSRSSGSSENITTDTAWDMTFTLDTSTSPDIYARWGGASEFQWWVKWNQSSAGSFELNWRDSSNTGRQARSDTGLTSFFSTGQLIRLGIEQVYNDGGTTITKFYYTTDFWSDRPAWTSIGEDDFGSVSSLRDVASSTLFVGTRDTSGNGTEEMRAYKMRFYDGSLATGTEVTTAQFNPNDTTGWTENGNAHIYTPPTPGTVVLAAGGNEALYSEDQTDAIYSGTNRGTATLGTGLCPLDNYYVLVDDNAGGSGSVNWRQTIAVSSGVNQGFGAFVRANGVDWCYLQTSDYDATGNGFTYFNIAAGTKGTQSANHSSASIERLSDGWCFVWISYQSTTALNGRTVLGLASGDTNTTVDRDGTSTLDVTGWLSKEASQLTVTDYVETTSGTVSTDADDLDSTAGHNQAMPLVMRCDVAFPNNSASSAAFEFHDGTANNRVLLYQNAANNVLLNVRANNVEIANLVIDVADNETHQYVLHIEEGNIYALADGVKSSVSATAGSFSSNLDTIDIGAFLSDSAFLNQAISKLAYFAGTDDTVAENLA